MQNFQDIWSQLLWPGVFQQDQRVTWLVAIEGELIRLPPQPLMGRNNATTDTIITGQAVIGCNCEKLFTFNCYFVVSESEVLLSKFHLVAGSNTVSDSSRINL